MRVLVERRGGTEKYCDWPRGPGNQSVLAGIVLDGFSGNGGFTKCSWKGDGTSDSNGLVRFLVALEALEFLAGLEADRFAGRNIDFFTGPGISANAGLARLDAEDAEAAELDALATAEGLLERFENGLDGLLGLGATDTRLGDDSVYHVQLNHTSLRRFRGQMLEGAAWVVKTCGVIYTERLLVGHFSHLLNAFR